MPIAPYSTISSTLGDCIGGVHLIRIFEAEINPRNLLSGIRHSEGITATPCLRQEILHKALLSAVITPSPNNAISRLDTDLV